MPTLQQIKIEIDNTVAMARAGKYELARKRALAIYDRVRNYYELTPHAKARYLTQLALVISYCNLLLNEPDELYALYALQHAYPHSQKRPDLHIMSLINLVIARMSRGSHVANNLAMLTQAEELLPPFDSKDWNIAILAVRALYCMRWMQETEMVPTYLAQAAELRGQPGGSVYRTQAVIINSLLLRWQPSPTTKRRLRANIRWSPYYQWLSYNIRWGRPNYPHLARYFAQL